jgi:beta-xylosidase
MTFIQAIIIEKSKYPIDLKEGCHLVKIKGFYYLVKTITIEENYV